MDLQPVYLSVTDTMVLKPVNVIHLSVSPCSSIFASRVLLVLLGAYSLRIVMFS